MIRRSWWLGACAALLPGLAQATALMLVDGVTGSAKLQGYAGWFEIRAYSWSIDRSKTAQPLQFNVEYEWTAPASTLAQLAVTGTILKKIVIDQVAPIDGGLLLVSRVTCDEASFRTTANSTSASDRSVGDLQVQCGRLQWEYFDYATNKGLTATGKGSWNFKTNTP
jgi:type VI protein secretion system component Hcp